jgi:bifunctional non-homologous end joining protein LigD
LDSRNAKDLTLSFPEVAAALAEALAGRRVSLDGELVASSPAPGAPDFGQLQQRLGTPAAAQEEIKSCAADPPLIERASAGLGVNPLIP